MSNNQEQATHDCTECMNGYFDDFDGSGWHNLCGAGRCYLCHQMYGGECDDFEEGTPPEGKSLL